MSARTPHIIVLPGASGKPLDLTILTNEGNFTSVTYPGWRRYIEPTFALENWMVELSSQIERIVPEGPIRILGFSIGAHFGYATALRLRKTGREITGFCALDSFMLANSAPNEGWKRRALADAISLFRERRIKELGSFAHLRLWRALLRFPRGRLPRLLRLSRGLTSTLARDVLFENELNMRLLVQMSVPWMIRMNLDPVPLSVPTIVMRTEELQRDDEAWRRRCPTARIIALPGTHKSTIELLEDAKAVEPIYSRECIYRLREAFSSVMCG